MSRHYASNGLKERRRKTFAETLAALRLCYETFTLRLWRENFY